MSNIVVEGGKGRSLGQGCGELIEEEEEEEDACRRNKRETK